MTQQNKGLLAVSIITIVSTLGYGIVIPIWYSYAVKYGLNDFQNGLLFAVFSICQFISTPIIGRLSDKFGRRPLLLISILGTAISFFISAYAPNAIFLFLARALDGATAGNIPVAAAVISDSTPPEKRARGFGIIGASFGFGFLFGPIIASLSLGFGIHVPFIVAGTIAAIATALTFFILPETNSHIGEVAHEKLFNFKKLIESLFDKNIGKTLAISFLAATAFSAFILAFQSYIVRVLHATPQQISLNFILIGVIGLISQAFIIPFVSKRVEDKKVLIFSLAWTGIVFLLLAFANNLIIFVALTLVNALGNGFIGPIIQSMLSKEVDAKSQGSIMGLNTSYASLGQILGPIIGGSMAVISITSPFILASIASIICVLLAIKILRQPSAPVSEF